MISLAAVEMLAAELWPNYNSAVVAIHDARKGERLVLVTDKHRATRADSRPMPAANTRPS